MRRALALGLALLAAGPASALTCARPDPFRSFVRAQEAPETYVLLLGRLSFDPALMPEGVQEGGGEPAPVPARFEGEALTPEGFTKALSADVTLRPTCTGPWCGAIGPGEAWLLFAQETEGRYEVEVGPCGGWVFEDPSQEILDGLAACMAGGACGP